VRCCQSGPCRQMRPSPPAPARGAYTARRHREIMLVTLACHAALCTTRRISDTVYTVCVYADGCPYRMAAEQHAQVHCRRSACSKWYLALAAVLGVKQLVVQSDAFHQFQMCRKIRNGFYCWVHLCSLLVATTNRDKQIGGARSGHDAVTGTSTAPQIVLMYNLLYLAGSLKQCALLCVCRAVCWR
jgi:hypothetical protein